MNLMIACYLGGVIMGTVRVLARGNPVLPPREYRVQVSAQRFRLLLSLVLGAAVCLGALTVRPTQIGPDQVVVAGLVMLLAGWLLPMGLAPVRRAGEGPESPRT